MPHGTMHRPLDGEILDLRGGGQDRHADPGFRDDAEVVRYEMLGASEKGLPERAEPSPRGQDTPGGTIRPGGHGESDNLAMLRRTPGKGGEAREPLAGRILKGTGFIVAGAAFWINGGHALFTGGAADALVIAAIDSRLEARDGAAMLRVDTRVENRGETTAVLPPVLVMVHARDGSLQRYKLGTSREDLAPGGSHLFSGHMAAPNIGVDRVSVRLAKAGDG